MELPVSEEDDTAEDAEGDEDGVARDRLRRG